MAQDKPNHDLEAQRRVADSVPERMKEPMPFLPSEVQLQNVFAIDITARRFPVETTHTPIAHLSMEDIEVDEQSPHANAVLQVALEFVDEPIPFELSFRLLGQFTYQPEYEVEKVQTFLERGSLSVMLPFAREMLFSLCTRLQIPPIMLSMIKLAPPTATLEEKLVDEEI